MAGKKIKKGSLKQKIIITQSLNFSFNPANQTLLVQIPFALFQKNPDIAITIDKKMLRAIWREAQYAMMGEVERYSEMFH